MMHATPETALCSAYQEQSECYRSALAAAEPLADSIRSGADHSQQLERVLALLAQAAAIDDRIRPLKERWLRGGSRPGPQLAAILAEAGQRMERLTRSLADAEQAAAQRHTQLLPQVETMIRGRQMRRAYRFA